MSALLTTDDLERIAKESNEAMEGATLREDFLAVGIDSGAALSACRDFLTIAARRTVEGKGGLERSMLIALCSAMMLGALAGREAERRRA